MNHLTRTASHIFHDGKSEEDSDSVRSGSSDRTPTKYRTGMRITMITFLQITIPFSTSSSLE